MGYYNFPAQLSVSPNIMFGCCAGCADDDNDDEIRIREDELNKGKGNKPDPANKYADLDRPDGPPRPKDLDGPSGLESKGWLDYKKSAESHLKNGGLYAANI